MIGKTISHYKILEKLGEGGMGVVYKAEDTKLDRLVALKFLPQHLTANKTDRERFVREAKAASAINHPNVCVIHDIQEYENQQFIVMEFVDGVTLRRKLESVPLETKEAVGYAIQIAEALSAAHGKGIIHRDVKSDNIMVTEASRIKVMDFGLARVKDSVRITRTSTTVGTLAYMSPEQIQGKDVDARSDIFSFGVLLYEMLAGRLPFQAEFESALMYAILNEEPEPVESLRPGLSPELVHVVNRALEKDPVDRYQSANDMLVDLGRVKRVSDRVSRVSTAGTAARPSVDAGGETTTREPAAARGHGRARLIRRLGLWMTVGLVGVAAVVFAVLKLFQGERAVPSFERMQMTRLTTSGNAKDAVISADGRYVVHVLAEEGKESLWIKQVATNSDVQVLPPAEVQYLGLTFSPDGNYVYYAAADKMGLGGALYRIPVLGGAASKVMDDIYVPVTFSPDGERFAFVAGSWKKGKTTLVVSNKDGTGQKGLAGRNSPDFFFEWSPAWSPDGKVVVCADAQYAPGETPFGIVAVKVEDGTEERPTAKKWGRLERIAWLRDGSGFLVPATDQSSGWFSQIWFVSYPEGVARRITHDLNNYMGLSLTEDSRTLVTVQSDRLSTIWIVEPGQPMNARQITFGKFDGFYGVAWTPDGRVVHGSRDLDIWLIDADGGNRQLLTVGERNNGEPVVSPDGRSIVFDSWRSLEAMSLWVMDIDGGNPRRLTFGASDCYPSWSPDGRWVVYRSVASGNPSVWKVPVGGGDPSPLTHAVSDQPAVSPDGKRVACFYEGDPSAPGERRIAVLPFEGGEPLEIFDIAPGTSRDAWLRWTPDGSAVTYAVDQGRVSNIWAQPLDASDPVKLTEFETLRILAFDWSKDGRLVCARGGVDNDVVLMRFE